MFSSSEISDLNYLEDSGGGPDVTVALLPKIDKVTLLQVSFFGFWSPL
jgi:exosome complex component RRP41